MVVSAEIESHKKKKTRFPTLRDSVDTDTAAAHINTGKWGGGDTPKNP